MAFDETSFSSAFFGNSYSESYKKRFNKGGGSAFPYLPTSKLLEGVYGFRWLPACPEKCPEGWLRVAVHGVSQIIGEDKPVRVACIRTQEDACAICDVLESTADEMEKLPLEIQTTLEKMVVNAIVVDGKMIGGGQPKLIIPVSIFAEPATPSDPKSKWKKSAKETGAMLEIYSVTLMEKLHLLRTADPMLAHETKGRYLSFIKKAKSTSIELPAASKPCPLGDPEIIKKYPHVVNAYLKNVKNFDYDQQNEFLESCWWFSEPCMQTILSATYYDNPETPTAVADDGKLPWE